jgi:mycobactin lysine-N-oxygenase
VHRHLPHDAAAERWLLHCDSPRGELLERIPEDEPVEVAIVGGGEGALSCLLFLREHRPDARLVVYTPSLPLSRGESFLENRVFADPDSVGWERLDLPTRRAFVQQCDRGVFDATNLSRISCDEQCRFETGRVLHIAGSREGGVCLDYASVDGPRAAHHDFAVNCTGFDVLAQVRPLFPPAVRQAIEAAVGPVWSARDGAELPIGRALELEGLRPRLHVPGLAGVAQGPGFANLGCLGLLANRVLQPCLAPDGGTSSAPLIADVDAEPALEA